MGLLRAVLALTLAAVLLLSVGIAPHPALAATVVVGEGAYACNFDGLEQAITDASTTDTSSPGLVTFNCPSPTISFAQEITIGGLQLQAVIIDGSNSAGDQIVFDWDGAPGFFAVNALGHLTIQHLTMQNGVHTAALDSAGGAIQVSAGGTLVAHDVIFSNNESNFGGAIDNSGTTIIRQSTFTNNKALFEEGGWGGAIQSTGSLIITQTTFDSNSANAGGAILSEGSLTVTQSSFTSNSGGAGGAIVSASTLSISQSSFVGNVTPFTGGAIYINVSAGDNPVITSSTFINNTSGGTGSALSVIDLVPLTSLSWSTIVQPPGTAPAIENGGNLELTGVILAGQGDNCLEGSGLVFDSDTLSDDFSCGLSGEGSVEGVADLGLGPLTTSTINGVEQSYFPLLQGSPAIDGSAADTCPASDNPEIRNLDQLHSPRPQGLSCDIGAIESSFSHALLCANRWNGALRYTDDCTRSEILLEPAYSTPIPLCVNQWNGAARMDDDCSRSEDFILVSNSYTVPICVNTWTATLRVSQSCTRSEFATFL